MAKQSSTESTCVCPLCGDFVENLNDFTGWCDKCSPVDVELSPAEIFLLRNADHIEHYLFQGKSLSQAIDSLRHELSKYRTCACCGALIERGGANVVFCRKTPKCVSTVRRYEYLHHRKGLSKPEALAVILEELNGSE